MDRSSVAAMKDGNAGNSRTEIDPERLSPLKSPTTIPELWTLI